MPHVYAHLQPSYAPEMDAARDDKRRSHLNRRAMRKRVEITGNDIHDIFEPLSRFAQLTTRQLVAFGSRNPIITKARLGELWHATEGHRSHWLHRLNEDLVFANHLFVEDMHRLGREGEALLIAKGIIKPEPWVSTCRIGGKSTSPSRIIRLAHDHIASDIAIDLEIGARQDGLPFKSHVAILEDAPEITRAQKKPLKIPVTLAGERTFVEPDALFSIAGRNYALEADRGTESIIAVIVPKILAYREAVASGAIDGHLGIDNLTVLFATTSTSRMQRMMDELTKIARNGKSTMFGFRAEPTFGEFLAKPAPSGRLIASAWHRVGHADLSLSS